jgi:hypothetical protein
LILLNKEAKREGPEQPASHFLLEFKLPKTFIKYILPSCAIGNELEEGEQEERPSDECHVD